MSVSALAFSSALPPGVVALPLAQLPEQLRLEMQERLASQKLPASSDVFCLIIPSGSHLQEPLRVSVTGVSTFLLMIARHGSHATIIEELRDGDAMEREHRVYVWSENAATVEFVSLNVWDHSIHGSLHHEGWLEEGASIAWRMATLGGKEVHHALRSHVQGSGAVSDVDWMFFAKAQEKQSLSVRNVFAAKDGRGEIVMKGVAQDHAHVSCDGMIEIGLQGGGTDTYLTQHVLMLDRTARVNAIPGLEIKTNDVKASHSATVTRVTDEDLFYFASRGIAQNEARRMYVQGFLADLAGKISDAEEREAIVGAIERKYETNA